MAHVLITGGAGFFGRILKQQLLGSGHTCVSIDLQPDEDTHPNLTALQGDLVDRAVLDKVFSGQKFDAIFHVAALLAHDTVSKEALWRANVDGTKLLAEYAKNYGVKKIIYTSSNCLFSKDFAAPVTEDEHPAPAEFYGKSKWEGEKILLLSKEFEAVVFRCPTIMAASRLGLMAILFEFIEEGRKVWVVGDGSNRYQYIYANDLAAACILAMECKERRVFNIGSDNVKPLRDVYGSVIAKAGTKARIASLPKFPTIELMKLLYWLGLSPLGPYHYKMIAANFVFDTSRIKKELGWAPTKTNEDMLLEAYTYYIEEKKQPLKKSVSAHRRAASMGIIRLLKWIS